MSKEYIERNDVLARIEKKANSLDASVNHYYSEAIAEIYGIISEIKVANVMKTSCEIKTNYDLIQNMGIEELAEFMYSAPDKICFENCKKDTGNKFSCKFGEGVDTANCINCMKNYFESEADVAYG